MMRGFSPSDLLTAREFSPSGYSAILRALSSLGYKFVPLVEQSASLGEVVMRHDIDLCLQSAAQIANIDQEHGVRSTFYVLLSTELYNPASASGRRALGQILDAGHDIGLHFDTSHYEASSELLEEAAARECAILEEIIGNSVRSISFHRPAAELLGREGSLAGRPHTYEPRYFNDLVYLADSEGRWRFGHPLDHPAVTDGRTLHLVTHPIWWVTPGSRVLDKLEAFRRLRAENLRKEMASNLKPFAAVYGPFGEKAPPV